MRATLTLPMPTSESRQNFLWQLALATDSDPETLNDPTARRLLNRQLTAAMPHRRGDDSAYELFRMLLEIVDLYCDAKAGISDPERNRSREEQMEEYEHDAKLLIELMVEFPRDETDGGRHLSLVHE